MRSYWQLLAATFGLAGLTLMASVWAAPLSTEEGARSVGTGSPSSDSRPGSPSAGLAGATLSTGNKGMDLLLETKMAAPPVDADRERGAARQLLAPNGQPFGATRTDTTKPNQSADNSPGGDAAVKQWVKDVGGAAAGSNQVVRESEAKADSGQRTSRQRQSSQQDGDAQATPSAFGQVITFIRENRMAMLMLCAAVLILAGAAFVYSSKASSGGRRFD